MSIHLWNVFVEHCKTVQPTVLIKTPREIDFILKFNSENTLKALNAMEQEDSSNSVVAKAPTPQLVSNDCYSAIRSLLIYNQRQQMIISLTHIINKLAPFIFEILKSDPVIRPGLQSGTIKIGELVSFIVQALQNDSIEKCYGVYGGVLVAALKGDNGIQDLVIQKNQKVKVPKLESPQTNHYYLTVCCYAYVAACMEAQGSSWKWTSDNPTEDFEDNCVTWNTDHTPKSMPLGSFANGQSEKWARISPTSNQTVASPPAAVAALSRSNTAITPPSNEVDEYYKQIAALVTLIPVTNNANRLFKQIVSVASDTKYPAMKTQFCQTLKQMRVQLDSYPFLFAQAQAQMFTKLVSIIRRLHDFKTDQPDRFRFFPAIDPTCTQLLMKKLQQDISVEAMNIDDRELVGSLYVFTNDSPTITLNIQNVCQTQLLFSFLCSFVLCRTKLKEVTEQRSAIVGMYVGMSNFLSQHEKKLGFDDAVELIKYQRAFGKCIVCISHSHFIF